MPVLEAHDIHKTYTGGDGGTINVLSGVDFALSSREMVAIVGASGAGSPRCFTCLVRSIARRGDTL